MRNKYIVRGRISEYQFRQIIKYFALDLEATKIAFLTHISRPSINKILLALREQIAAFCEVQSPYKSLKGDVEVDESYFGGRRKKGLRGRGASGKLPVFGLLKRQGKVYTEIVDDCSKATLQAIIRGKVDLDSVIHSDGWGGYDGLVDIGFKKHKRVNHSNNEFASETSHINGIESFWGFAKTRLAKFRGVPERTFYLHLKECEFRFNYRQKNLYQLILKIARNNPLKLS